MKDDELTRIHPQRAAGEIFEIRSEFWEMTGEQAPTSFACIDLCPTFKGETEEEQQACQKFLDALISTCHNVIGEIPLSHIQKYLETGAKVSACRFRLNGELIFEIQITKG